MNLVPNLGKTHYDFLNTSYILQDPMQKLCSNMNLTPDLLELLKKYIPKGIFFPLLSNLSQETKLKNE